MSILGKTIILLAIIAVLYLVFGNTQVVAQTSSTGESKTSRWKLWRNQVAMNQYLGS